MFFDSLFRTFTEIFDENVNHTMQKLNHIQWRSYDNKKTTCPIIIIILCDINTPMYMFTCNITCNVPSLCTTATK